MPWVQATIELANEKLNSKNIGDLDAQKLSAGQDLAEIAEAVGVDVDRRAAYHLRNWPQSVAFAIGAAIGNAISRSQGDEKVAVQLTWTPAVGFGASIWEVSGLGGSPTAITIQLQSPMPEPPQTA